MRMTRWSRRPRPVRGLARHGRHHGGLAFLLFVVGPAYNVRVEEASVTTPMLEISKRWRAAALPVGLGLMALMAAIRLVKVGDWKQVAGAVATVAVACLGSPRSGRSSREWATRICLIFFVGVTAATVLIGVPIAVAFGLATFGFLTLTTNVAGTGDGGPHGRGDVAHHPARRAALRVPRLLIEMTGMARAMVAFLASLLGHVRGGLSYVLMGAMYLVSGISGSKVADMAAVAPVLFPEMRSAARRMGIWSRCSPSPERRPRRSRRASC
jgi:hypothetical protein